MASISQRGKGWRVLWRYGGTRTGGQQSWTYTTEQHAQHAKQIAEAHRHRITAVEVAAAVLGIKYEPPTEEDLKHTPTVSQFAKQWLASRTQATDRTKIDHQSRLDRIILPAIGDVEVHRVTGTDIAAVLNPIIATRSTSTADAYYLTMQSLFAFAVVEGLRDDNPAKRINYKTQRPSARDATDPDDDRVHLQMWEFELIVSHLHPDALPLVLFLAGTGCRWSEATAVPVSAIDLDKREARIYRAWKLARDGDDPTGRRKKWIIGPTKGRNKRTVPLPQAVLDAVTPLLKGRPKDALVFEPKDLRRPKVDEPTPARGERGKGKREPRRLAHNNFVTRRWDPAVTAAMRCPEHPPPPRGRRVPYDPDNPQRCGTHGGRNSRGEPCGRWAAEGWNRCHDCLKPAKDAVSTCGCRRLTRRPTPHDLRHSLVEWSRTAGIPMAAISRQVGHQDMKITDKVYSSAEVSPAVAAMFDTLYMPEHQAERRGSPPA